MRDRLPVISQWANTAWGRKKEIEANALIHTLFRTPAGHHRRDANSRHISKRTVSSRRELRTTYR